MNIAHHSLMAYAVIVLACSSVQAQTYRSEEVIDKAERYLQEVVGDELIRYFIYDTYSYYSYAQRRGHVEYETLIAADSTLGRFLESNVRFIIVHPEYSASTYPQLKNWVGIRLDKDLNLKDKVDVSFIPPFVLDGRPSDFLTEESVMNILQNRGLKEGILPPEIVLQFDSRRSYHYWFVANTLRRNKCNTRAEVAQIHAVTGEIISFRERSFLHPECQR